MGDVRAGKGHFEMPREKKWFVFVIGVFGQTVVLSRQRRADLNFIGQINLICIYFYKISIIVRLKIYSDYD
jgi:hypothetical protein